ncbi:MAG: hypothetical protein HYT82_02935 [Candidatus Harrisonbacteria bacterium]|nr:hypothetical protein [Candidatus Harrisonbacteria bacterium]
MSTIAQWVSQWVSAHKREVILTLLALLISTTSFAAGYLFARDTNQTPIVIEKSG